MQAPRGKRLAGTALRVVVSLWLVTCIGSACTAVAADKAPANKEAAKKEPKATIKTKFGEMEVRFFSDIAPKHVENFLKLAKDGFYNGTIFHRVMPGFMIQGGDPNTKDSKNKDAYGTGGPGYNVKAEFSDRPHKRGVLSMARAQDPDSAGSQFFIVVEDSRFLDGKYTVFGEVVKGIGVADKIVNSPRVLCDSGRPNPPGQGPCDNPLERIDMTVVVE